MQTVFFGFAKALKSQPCPFLGRQASTKFRTTSFRVPFSRRESLNNFMCPLQLLSKTNELETVLRRARQNTEYLETSGTVLTRGIPLSLFQPGTLNYNSCQEVYTNEIWNIGSFWALVQASSLVFLALTRSCCICSTFTRVLKVHGTKWIKVLLKGKEKRLLVSQSVDR